MEEKENLFRMKISDPELVQKIREGGIESLSPDDINSLGIEVKDGHISINDASEADLDGSRRIKLGTAADKKSESLPIKRGFIGYIGILFGVLVVLSVIGIICCEMYPQLELTGKDMIFLSLFIVVGLGISLNEFRVAAVYKKYMTERVQGRCISHEYASGSESLNTRRTVYEYTYRGNVYRSCENVYANKGYAKMGEVRELLISPENPRDIYDPKASNARKFGGIIIGMIFIGIPVVMLVCTCVNG